MRTRSIRAKLLLCLALVLAAGIAANISAVVAIRSLKDDSARMLALEQDIVAAGRVEQALAAMRNAGRGLILFSIQADPQVEKDKAQFRALAAQVRELATAMQADATTDRERQQLQAMVSGVDEWLKIFEQGVVLCAAGSTTEATKLFAEKTRPIIVAIQTTAGAIQQNHLREMQAAAGENEARARNSLWLATALAVALLAAGALAVVIVSRMEARLRKIAHEVASGAARVAAGAAQVRNAGSQLANAASEQAASLEETSSSSEEIASMTRQNVEHTSRAVTVVAKSATDLDAADAELRTLVDAIDAMAASSEQVSKIIGVIQEIAFQTNILALNAAVEAARAGDAGMGFSVVADEVRNLAQRSGAAARETSALIEAAVHRSKEVQTKAASAAQVIGRVRTDGLEVKTLIEEVSAGSEQQSSGIAQIASAVHEMQRLTQSSAAETQESAAAGEQLNSEAGMLSGAAQRLTALLDGGR